MPFDITEDESWRIITLRAQGYSEREIVQQLNGKHHRSQVHRVINYYGNYGEVPKYRQHTRHKQMRIKNLDSLASDRLEYIYEQNPCLYLDEATKQLNEVFGYKYSEWSVNKALQKIGLTLKEVQKSDFFVLVVDSILISSSTVQSSNAKESKKLT